MKNVIIFCIGSLLLLKIRDIKQNKSSNKKIHGIIFGETGVNFTYQLGILKYMEQNFQLYHYKFCGISGGCHCAFIMTNKINVDDFYNQFIIEIFNHKNKDKYTSIFDISKIALFKLYKSICDLQNMNKKLYISMSKVFPYLHNHTICEYNSYDELYDCIKSSQYIPFLFGYPYTKYNNSIYIDGYITSFYYKPTNENWITIKIWNFNLYYYLTCILNFRYLFDENYHAKCFQDGYEDAKKKHSYFLQLGLFEK